MKTVQFTASVMRAVCLGELLFLALLTILALQSESQIFRYAGF